MSWPTIVNQGGCDAAIRSDDLILRIILNSLANTQSDQSPALAYSLIGGQFLAENIVQLAAKCVACKSVRI